MPSPVRTSSTRSLGGFANVFALESFALGIVGVLLDDNGPEKTETSETMYRTIAGLSGKIGTSSWSWESAAMLGGVSATDRVKNAVRDSYLQAAAQRRPA